MAPQPPTSDDLTVADAMLVGGAAAVVAWSAPPPLRSPDGLEMVGSMLAGTFDLAFWPPLWALLASGAALVAGPDLGPWLLGVGAATLTTLPLAWLGLRLGGVLGLRVAAAGWAVLPAVSSHAAVIDARPLSWLLVATAGALAAEGVARRRAGPWFGALFVGALGALTRPELLALAPVLAAASLVLGPAGGLSRRGAVAGAALALAPAVLLRLAAGSAGVGWQQLWPEVAGAWTAVDFVALHGAGSAGTPYRAFVDRVVAAGLESLPAGGLLALDGVPERIGWLLRALEGAAGVVLLLLATAGAVLRVDPRRRAVAVVVAMPLLALVLVEKAWGQLTLAATVLWAVPLILAAAGRGLGVLLGPRGGRGLVGWVAPAVVVLSAGLEGHLGPVQAGVPSFVEDAPAMDEAATRLAAAEPGAAPVACTITGRGLVRRAGLVPRALPSRWEAWEPPAGTRVVLTSADLQGEDGGRGFPLLLDPGWAVAGVAGEAPAPGAPAGDWVLWLERR